MRETTSGWQHVGWLDASQAEPGHQKRRRCLFGPQTITWDGIATESAALADSPDVFTEGSAPFHRALPEVISGEPVPPPYYTIFFRYREADSDTAEIIDETSTIVYVPQVVKIEMTDEAYNNSTTNMNGWIMNGGRCTPDAYHFRKSSFVYPTWKPRNANYLHFILPRP